MNYFTTTSFLRLLAACLFAAAPLYAQSIEFEQSEPIPVSEQPRQVASGDFNNDGSVDLAFAHADGLVVQVYFGNYEGEFMKLNSEIQLPLFATWIATDDLDNDGDLDLVVTLTQNESQFLRVYKNNGAGRFELDREYIVGRTPWDGVLADLNYDGWVDIVVANNKSNTLTVMFNDQLGNFDEHLEFGSLVRPAFVLVEDMDADGFLDIVATGRDDPDCHIYYGNSEGAFVLPTTINIGASGSWHIPAVADFDKDGRLDIVVFNGIDRNTSYIKQIGDREFQTPFVQTVGLEFVEALAEDFNNDGWVDLFAVSQRDNSAFVWQNGPGGILTKEPQIISTHFSPRFLHSVDLNDDGYKDVLIVHQEPGAFSYWMNIGDFNTISGSVFTDLGENCVKDENSQPLVHRVVNFEPGNHYVLSDENGDYTKHLPEGEYSISVADEELWITNCDKTTQLVKHGESGEDLSGIDFPQNATEFRHKLRLSLISSRIRPGIEGDYVVQYENVGTVPYTGSIEMLFDDVLEFQSFTQVPEEFSNGRVVWFLSEVPIGTRGQILIRFATPRSVARGRILCAEVQALRKNSEELLSDEHDELCVEVTAGYDPNDIRVWPAGNGHEGWISQDVKTLSYMIRFQNTGNDTTFNVVVRDTLPGSLDVKRLRFGASSHDYSVSLLKNHILEFTFPDIRLPDSTTDELGSQGYVKYRIDIAADTEVGTRISHRAGIYFDFNPVVLTNYAVSTIVETSTSVVEALELPALNVFPNPTAETLTVGGINTQASQLEIVDLLGRCLMTVRLENQQSIELNIGGLSAGIYFVQTRGEMEHVLQSGQLQVKD